MEAWQTFVQEAKNRFSGEVQHADLVELSKELGTRAPWGKISDFMVKRNKVWNFHVTPEAVTENVVENSKNDVTLAEDETLAVYKVETKTGRRNIPKELKKETINKTKKDEYKNPCFVVLGIDSSMDHNFIGVALSPRKAFDLRMNALHDNGDTSFEDFLAMIEEDGFARIQATGAKCLWCLILKEELM